MQISGLFAPEECNICGKNEEALYFDDRTGAFYCAEHRTPNSIFVYDAVRKAFAYVLEKEGRAVYGFNLSEEALEQLTVILRNYMDIHMDLRLKTRDFFA